MNAECGFVYCLKYSIGHNSKCSLGVYDDPTNKKLTNCYMGYRGSGDENSWDGDGGNFENGVCFPASCGVQDSGPCNGKGTCHRWDANMNKLGWGDASQSVTVGCDCNNIPLPATCVQLGLPASDCERESYNYMCELKSNSVHKETYLEDAVNFPTGELDTANAGSLEGMGGEYLCSQGGFLSCHHLLAEPICV